MRCISDTLQALLYSKCRFLLASMHSNSAGSASYGHLQRFMSGIPSESMNNYHEAMLDGILEFDESTEPSPAHPAYP